jgi:glutamine synthetase adenylyltransferase
MKPGDATPRDRTQADQRLTRRRIVSDQEHDYDHEHEVHLVAAAGGMIDIPIR